MLEWQKYNRHFCVFAKPKIEKENMSKQINKTAH